MANSSCAQSKQHGTVLFQTIVYPTLAMMTKQMMHIPAGANKSLVDLHFNQIKTNHYIKEPTGSSSKHDIFNV